MDNSQKTKRRDTETHMRGKVDIGNIITIN